MRFRFPLQRVLELRAQKEQAVAAELASARNVASVAQGEADALSEQRATGRDRLREEHGTQQTVGVLQHMTLVLEHLDQRIAEQARVVDAAEAEVSRVRVDLTHATQERRVLDRLRERQHEAFRTEEAQKDLAQMDAIALSRFTQQQQQSQTNHPKRGE